MTSNNDNVHKVELLCFLYLEPFTKVKEKRFYLY